MIVRRSSVEIEKLRRSGLLVYRILQDLKPLVVEGSHHEDLEVAAEKMIADAGANRRSKATTRRLRERNILTCSARR